MQIEAKNIEVCDTTRFELACPKCQKKILLDKIKIKEFDCFQCNTRFAVKKYSIAKKKTVLTVEPKEI